MRLLYAKSGLFEFGSRSELSEYTDERLRSCANGEKNTAPEAKGSGSESVRTECWYDDLSLGWSEGVRGSEMVWKSEDWSTS